MVAGRRVGVVVRGHVDGLERRDRALLGRGDPLLELAHLSGERRLVSHRRRHAAEKRRHFGARLREAEDVVDEEEDVAALRVAEVLGHRQPGEADAQTDAGGLVHLAEDHDGLVDDARFGHLAEEVVAFAGPLADTGEHGIATVLGGDVANELLDDDGLADAGAAEEADLTAALERGDQVDDLDAGLEDLRLGLLLLERRRIAMDRQGLLALHRALAVERPSEHVEDAAEGRLADRDRDRGTGVDRVEPTAQAVGRRHGDGSAPSCCQGAAGPRR